MIDKIANWLISEGFSESLAGGIGGIAVALAILFLAWLSNAIAKGILLKVVSFFIKRSKTRWDDALQSRKVFVRFSHLAPILVIYFGAAALPSIQETLERISIAYMYFMGLLIFNAFLGAVMDIYQEYDVSRDKPIKGYVQIVQIIAIIFVGILIFARLMDRSPVALLTGLGAMTAILLLVFKDTILGLVASLQLSFNDMVRRGDWIEMPKFGADGDVIDVSLHTVKVQNWDKTITTIPTYALISDSFKNWRGMSESGGRRIKRSINIDMNSIRFCTEKMIERFEKIQYIADYIAKKIDEITIYNEEKQVDTSTLANGRHLTNIGTFRAYVVAYLRNHPKIHQSMTFLIRQLQPTEHGLPIEIYVFSNDQEWASYEAIQADIFDHILAVVPEFDLQVYQSPTGHDFRTLTESSRVETR
ncbi:MAG: mechanosensitive ion channel family protein [Candidatus Zixiibacteriota bacterium]|nr:MAG: mechanosensitive ion channel family protein [candidate division Zixibacteria bacterium]